MGQQEVSQNIETYKALSGFPYFALKREVESGYSDLKRELVQIKRFYVDYQKGTIFYPEGNNGDYVPSTIRFKIARTLINKEARFMFSQTPDINIIPKGIGAETTEQIKSIQSLLDTVLENCNFSRILVQSAKDCFIGKRVACLVDYSEDDGVQVHFYNSLQFYYETDYGSDRLTKFVSFECVTESKSTKDRRFLINRYEERDGKIYVSSILYDGAGVVMQEPVPEIETDYEYIPAVVIFNDGTLEDKRGVSEMEDLADYEGGYSKFSNADMDSGGKAMNPVRYTVDMNPNTTKDLSSGPGAYWDLHSDQNQDATHPTVGVLSPQMNHTESIKVTLDRLKSAMYGELDVPNISEETMVGRVTSGKTLKALYWPLSVRCNEKLTAWIPALKFMVRAIVDTALLNVDGVKQKYVLEELTPVLYDVDIVANYALLDDEFEEKAQDLEEINANARSRKSYLKKWRKSEFQSDEKLNEELMQIAIEVNMFDSLSMNTSVQSRLDETETETEIEDNLKTVETNSKLDISAQQAQ